jgi:YVTN family beta-propeller protein
MLRLSLGLLVIPALCLGWIMEAHAATFAYVPNGEAGGTVSVINTTTNTEVDTDGNSANGITGILIGMSPIGVAVSPDSRFVYVTNQTGDPLSVIDTVTNIARTVPVTGVTNHRGIAVHPEGTILYIATTDSGVAFVGTETFVRITGRGAAGCCRGIAIHPDGSEIYVTNPKDATNTASVINTTTLAEQAISIGRNPTNVAVHPSGRYLYGVNQDSASISINEIATRQVILELGIGSEPWGIAIDPDSSHIFVTIGREDKVAVVPIDADGYPTSGVTRKIPEGTIPGGVSVDSSTDSLYVLNTMSNTVSVVDLTTYAVKTIIPMGVQPNAMGSFIVGEVIIPVTIDIKPGDTQNCFKNDGHGVIQVAILSSAEFNATKVDPRTVTLAGLAVKVAGNRNKLLAHTEDINGDGLIDLVVQIEDPDHVFTVGTTTATLKGKLYTTFGGTPIEGTDAICIVP